MSYSKKILTDIQALCSSFQKFVFDSSRFKTQPHAVSSSTVLTAVARPPAAWSGTPTIAREARRADSRYPEECADVVFACNYIVHSAVNDIVISLVRCKKNYQSSSGVPRGVTRQGDGVHSRPWRPP